MLQLRDCSSFKNALITVDLASFLDRKGSQAGGGSGTIDMNTDNIELFDGKTGSSFYILCHYSCTNNDAIRRTHISEVYPIEDNLTKTSTICKKRPGLKAK